MSDGNWFQRNRAIIVKWLLRALITATVLMIGGGAIVRGLVEQSEFEWSSNQRNAEYAAEAYGPAYDACLRLSSEGQPDCIAKANNEYRENERKEQDLIAQQTTAVWTFLMGCAAIVGMMLSGLGVYLVFTTFNETRKANEIASNTSRQQLRPYVHATKIVCGDGTTDVNGNNVDSLTYLTHFANFGQTPAKNVMFSVEWVLTGPDGDVLRQRNWPTVAFGDIPPNFTCDFDVRILDGVDTIKNAIWQSHYRGTFRGKITYSSAEGGAFETDFNWYSEGTHFHSTPMKRHNNGNTST